MSEPEMIFDRKLLREVVCDDAEDYTMLSSDMTSQSRWHISMETVFRRNKDNKLFICYWRQGATENQDSEYPLDAIECEMYTKTIVKYRPMPRTLEGMKAVETGKPSV